MIQSTLQTPVGPAQFGAHFHACVCMCVCLHVSSNGNKEPFMPQKDSFPLPLQSHAQPCPRRPPSLLQLCRCHLEVPHRGNQSPHPPGLTTFSVITPLSSIHAHTNGSLLLLLKSVLHRLLVSIPRRTQRCHRDRAKGRAGLLSWQQLWAVAGYKGQLERSSPEP